MFNIKIVWLGYIMLTQIVRQLNIESIENWCKNNKLALNINKCKVMLMTFSRKANIDGQLLERYEKIKDLGVYFDCKLTFNAHIEYLLL
jgi:hypothetical protein